MEVLGTHMFALIVCLASRTLSEETCSSPLGMESRDIKDAQISCWPSSSCQRARLNAPGGGWIAYTRIQTTYNQVDLLSLKRLTKVAVRGVNSYYTKSFRIFYSKDGLVWEAYKPGTNSSYLGQELPGNVDSSTLVEQYLNPPIHARFVAINPVTYHSYPALQYELYGCDSDIPLRNIYTNITQDIQSDEVFSTSLSPYLIDREISVRKGVLLTIQTGVRVIFTTAQARLKVQGTLRTEGVGSLQVIFSHTTIPLSNIQGKWGGIIVEDGGEVDFTNTDIWQAEVGISGPAQAMKLNNIGVYMSGTGIQLTSGNANSTFPAFVGGNMHLCQRGIRLLDSSDQPYFGFDSFIVKNNLYEGVTTQSHYLSLNITNSVVSNNGRTGIYAYYYLDYLYLAETVVENNNDGLYIRGIKNSMHVTSCTMTSNRGYAIQVYNTFPGSAVLTQNMFKNNRGGVALRLPTALIDGNTFLEHSSQYALDVTEYRPGTINVTGNVFEDNQKGVNLDSSSAVFFTYNKIYRTSGQYAFWGKVANLTFHHNSVVNSTGTTAVYFTKTALIHIAYNVFNNPDSDFEMGSGIPVSGNTVIAARLNYWGSTNITYISSRIYDFYVDMKYIPIFIVPVYLSGELNELSDGQDSTVFTTDSFHQIGGRLIENVTLTQQNYTVTRSLFVPEDIHLTITDGAELQFLNDRGILVRGMLTIRGDENSIVSLKPVTGSSWRGIVVENTGVDVSFTEMTGVSNRDMFTLSNFTKIELSSVSLTGGQYGFHITQSIKGQLTLRNTTFTRMRTGIYSNILAGADVNYNIEQSAFSQCTDEGIDIQTDYRSNYDRSLTLSLNRITVVDCAYGMRLYQRQQFNANFTIENSTFDRTRYGAIYVSSQSSRISISNSIFTSSPNVIYLGVNGFCQNTVLSGNTFLNTISGKDVEIQGRFSGNRDNCSLLISDNIFQTSPEIDSTRDRDAIYINGYNFYENITIERNQFKRLTDMALEILYNSKSGNITVTDNLIDTCKRAVSIKVDQGSSPNIWISRNDINHNTGDQIVSLIPGQSESIHFTHNLMSDNNNTVVFAGLPTLEMHYNVFMNPWSDFNIKLGGTGDILNASLNFWGELDPRDISRKLFDGNDDSALSVIVFEPYFSNSSLVNLYEGGVDFITAGGRVGGKVIGNVTLSLTGSPYTAVGNIDIGEEDCLVIEAGVTIYFLSNIKMTVTGKLIAVGNSTHEVFFLSETPGNKWLGVDFVQSGNTARRKNIRLVGGQTENEGRVEILHDGQFGTICHDLFDVLDARVVCRMLGYNPDAAVEVRYSASFGRGEGPIWMDDLQCTGSELDVSQCVSRPWGSHNCYHGQDVGVICQGIRQNTNQSEATISELFHLHINDTETGLKAQFNLPKMNRVSVSFSTENGFSFYHTSTPNDDWLTNLQTFSNGIGGIYVEGAWNLSEKLVISGCVVSKNTDYGILAKYSGNLEISSCIISGSKTGIHLDNVHSGSVTILSSEFRELSEYMLYADRPSRSGANFSFLLSDSFVHDCSNRYRVRWWWNYRPLIDIYVHENSRQYEWVFINNIFSHLMFAQPIIDLEIGDSNQGSNNIVISNNTFKDSNSEFININRGGTTFIDITRNVFDNNTTPTDRPFVQLQRLSPGNTVFSVQENIFRNNDGISILHLVGGLEEHNRSTLSDNEFVNNTVRDVVMSDIVGFNAEGNIFNNSHADCEIRAPSFVDFVPINAKRTYWGVTNLRNIVERICGFHKDMRLSRISFIPYLLSPDKDDLISVKDLEFYLDETLGGDIQGELAIPSSTKPLFIQRSIFVSESGLLRIEGGATWIFKENRGIFVKGNAFIGTDEPEITHLIPENGSTWHGIVFSAEKETKSQNVLKVSEMKRTVLNNSRHGLTIERKMLRMYNNKILNTIDNGVTISTEEVAIHFNGSRVENSGQYGIFSQLSSDVKITNVTVLNSGRQGVYINMNSKAYNQTVFLEGVHVIGSQGHGIAVDSLNSVGTQKVSVLRSYASNNTGYGLYVTMSSHHNVHAEISENNLTNNEKGFYVLIRPYPYWAPYSQRYLNITGNAIEQCGGNEIIISSYIKVRVVDNTIENSNTKTQCALRLDSSRWDNNKPELIKTIDISTNRFTSLWGRCVVELLDASNDKHVGTFLYNQIQRCSSSEASLLLESFNYNLTDNVFDNTNTVYEMRMAKAGDEEVNAQRNWWGSQDLEYARRRIYDKEDDSSLISVDIVPIRNSLGFDCSQVNNCSDRGECVRPNGCRCISGWTGPLCTEYDCSQVSNCFQHGQCIGPNTCQCFPGYTGGRCESATCHNVMDCSSRGFCVAPDKCLCFSEYSGPSCLKCAPDRWGDECKQCPFCVQPQGSCNEKDGTCDCAINWDGERCEVCAESFYGPECEPLVTVLNVFPDGGPDTGGTDVHIRGHNFPSTVNNTYYCRFGRSVVKGERISSVHVVCMTPELEEATYVVEISPDGRSNFTNNKVGFTVYAKCPPGACGKDLVPPHGSCAFGGCVCTLPWAGDGCVIQLKSPIIKDVPIQTVVEGDSLSLQLELIQGSPPVVWSISNAPQGMLLDVRSASIIWDRSVGSNKAYSVRIAARNTVGQTLLTLIVRVPLSYNVTVDSISPSGVLHSPQAVVINGHVEFWQETVFRVVLVDVRVHNFGKIRTLSTFTNPSTGTFSVTFNYQTSDHGSFSVSANHPSDLTFREQAEWFVQGLRCSPQYISLTEYLDKPEVLFRGVSKLVNIGNYPINNIQTKVIGVGSRLESVTVVNNRTNNDNSRFTDVIELNQEVLFDMVLRASGPLRGTIALVFTAEMGTTTTCRVGIELNVRRPHFSVNPGALNEDQLIGSQRNYQLEVINDGQAPATNMRVELPDDPRISQLAFTRTSNVQESNNTQGSQLNLLKSESALLTLAVTLNKNDKLGEMKGQIAVVSEEVSIAVPYHFNLVSDNRLNLTVRVEDEFTYFDDDHPLVGEAKVTLSNGRKSYRKSLETTNITGAVTFQDITEDKYNLYVTAPGHSSYAAVIVATRSSSSVRVFLERIAVTYTWSVTPTTFEDRYVITLETTFETQVPMPVVTVEPSKINTIPYEEGREDTIEFLVTNHGLIRAENVQLDLPLSHPWLIFHQDETEIGHLEANTSIIVLVRVERKVISTTQKPLTTRSNSNGGSNGGTNGGTNGDPNGDPNGGPNGGPNGDPNGGTNGGRTCSGEVSRRTSSSVSCAILVFYDYFCGVTITRRIVVSLTREYPGRPSMPCSIPVTVVANPCPSGPSGVSVSGIRGPRRFTGGGGVVVYSPITPISCDCAKSFVKNCIPFGSCAVSALEASVVGVLKDCVLPILPLGGCAKSVIGAILSEWTFLNAISNVIDISLSCVVSSICPICSPIWKTTKCLFNVAIDCFLGMFGRKRDVSSSIVENLVVKSQPLSNFLDLAENIFGDRSILDLESSNWYAPFKFGVADDSEAGNLLTTLEYNTIWQNINGTDSQQKIQRFLTRWNNTAKAFQDGSLASRTDDVIPFTDTTQKYEQFIEDNRLAKEAGFDSIFDEFDNAVNIYIDARKQQKSKDEGVCAKVRVRIVQDLVLTRDAFNARLEIENGEQSDLTDIKVVIEISPSKQPGFNALDKFAIGDPELMGITGVEGKGSLGTEVSGVAEWLIVPYANAAIRVDTQYDVGGKLSYSVGSSSLTVSLLPDTITVKPNPNLEVHYFHEKYVIGDDPFTDPVEPSVPFVLAVMITNTGYGVAKNLKLTSGEPEIVENEKGLLVSFKITGTALNGKNIPLSLNIDFGEVQPFETTVARWYLTTSLRGLFYNYTATFENINPLGDPQLSVLDVLRIHELIHLVRKDVPSDDNLDDFLVNDDLDVGQLADQVFDSSNGSGEKLKKANVTRFETMETSEEILRNFTFVELEVIVEEQGWFYIRQESELITDNSLLLYVKRSDDKVIQIDQNTWTTDYYRDTTYFHLFDYSTGNNTNVTYSLTFGPRNMFEPEFRKDEYRVEVEFPLRTGDVVTTVIADDRDSDLVSYSIHKSSLFEINNETGVLRITDQISEPTILTVTVNATDNGIPSKSSWVVVTLIPMGSNNTTKPSSPSSTSSTAASTQANGLETTTEYFWNSTLSFWNFTLNSTSTAIHVPITKSMFPVFLYFLVIVAFIVDF